ncbi:MAG TPA: hypothetical protein VMW58_10285 [Anaerolineae bacterium]|nr:hypothetical protein [Anaerolineae bacterium]
MGAYHQMGHDSRNLLSEAQLGAYAGAVLSPVNYDEEQTRSQVQDHKADSFEFVFDPQLYYPTSRQGKLPKWSYYPADVDTADQSSFAWWRERVRDIAATAERIRSDSVCSPSVVPHVTSDEYYHLNARIADELSTELTGTPIDVLQTLLVRLQDLSQAEAPARIASIASGSQADGVYLVLVSDVQPRRELHETEDLKGAMRLIRHLEQSGMRVLVAFASTDIVLWKAAGASACATGKFFNIRRFTPSRWQPAQDGGGQVGYWVEESMMAFLRESDLVRVRSADLLSPSTLSNPYGTEILRMMDQEPGRPWLGLSWRHYLYWFADFENRLANGVVRPEQVLASAEQVWDQLEAKGILMEKRPNDGSWLRPWRRALIESFR